MADREEKREFTRVPLPFPVTITSDGLSVTSRAARNVSARGIFVESRAEMTVGSACTVRIDLVPALDAPSVEAKGRVVRVATDGIGVEFTEIGLGSFEHLRRFIRLNAPDPQQVDREFIEHLGLLRR